MKKYLFILAATATMAACSNDDGLSIQSTDTADRDIVFETNIQGETRSMARGLTTYGSGDEKFYIWADQMELVSGVYTEHQSYIDAWNFKTATTAGRLTTTGNVAHKWPAVNRLRFYAIHGNFSGTNSTITNNVSPFPKAELSDDEAQVAANLGPLRHTVPINQISTREGRDNYQSADLLYAVVPTIGYQSMVPLHFYHLMSKVEVCLKKGEGITLEELQKATIRITNVKNQVDFVPKRLSVSESGTPESGRLSFNASELTGDAETRTTALASMLSLPEQSLVTIDLRQLDGERAVSATADVTEPEWAIIVPQKFEDDSEAAIEISWSGKTVKVPLKGNTFECGKVYTYNVTLNHVGTSYGFNPTVTAWGDDSDRPIDVTSGS